MAELIEAAAHSRGISNPNPLVASAVVKDGERIAVSVHGEYGSAHSEAMVLSDVGRLAKGATLYVTLEPCTHWGKNPPCTDAIIQSGISKVVYAVDDPNPDVRRQSARSVLEAANIDVISGVLRDEAMVLNEVYFKNRIFNMPFVTLKLAMSKDRKIAAVPGEKTAITETEALVDSHQLRREVDAILVGVDTVLCDNPRLDVRHNMLTSQHRHPRVVVLDRHLRTPPDSAIFMTNVDTPPLILCSEESLENRRTRSLHTAEVAGVTERGYGLDWEAVLGVLFDQGLGHVLIEGGQKVAQSALVAGVVDKCVWYQSSSVIGENGVSAFQDDVLPVLLHEEMTSVGDDTRITGYLNSPREWLVS